MSDNLPTEFLFQFNTANNDVPVPANFQIGPIQTQKAQEEMATFLDKFAENIISLNLKQTDTSFILQSCSDLVKNNCKMNEVLIKEQTSSAPTEILKITSNFICDKFSSLNSVFKRTKDYEVKPSYVAPIEIAIGTRWELKKVRKGGRVRRILRRVQSTFQFVSILETLEALFKIE